MTPSSKMRSSARMTLPLVVITVLAALLRLPTLGWQSLWLDEAMAAFNARLLSGYGVEAMASADHLPPLSFALQALTVAVMGENEVALRLPSALFGVAAPWLTALVAYRMLERRSVALIAAVLMAAAPYAVWYSQEARMYSLLIFLALAYVLTAWPVIENQMSVLRWVTLTLLTIAGLWTHHYFALLIVAYGLFLLSVGLLTKPAFRIWLGSQASAAMCFVPWLVMSSRHASGGSGFGKADQLLWVPYALFSFIGGHSFGPTTRELRLLPVSDALMGSAAEVLIGGLLLLGVAVAALPVLWRTARRPGIWLILWLTVPLVLAALAPLVTNISFNVRYVSVSFPAFVIVWAVACGEVLSGSQRIRRFIGAAVVILTTTVIIWSLTSWYTDPRDAKEDIRSLARELNTQVQPGDNLVLANGAVQFGLRFYGWQCSSQDTVILGPDGARALAVGVANAPSAAGRTWVVSYRPWETDPEGLVLAAYARRGPGQVEGEWPGVRLYRFEGSFSTSAIPDKVWRGCAPCQPAEAC